MAAGEDDPGSVAVAAQEAAHRLRRARQRLAMQARAYHDIRAGISPRAIARAHGEWGLSLFEWAEAAVAYAVAEDGCQHLGTDTFPEPSGLPVVTLIGQVASAPADDSEVQSARRHRDTCWTDYLNQRKSGDLEALMEAREQWTSALLSWVRAFAAAEAATDRRRVSDRQHHLDQGMQVGATGNITLTRKAEIVHQSRARARREALERDRLRETRVAHTHTD